MGSFMSLQQKSRLESPQQRHPPYQKYPLVVSERVPGTAVAIDAYGAVLNAKSSDRW